MMYRKILLVILMGGVFVFLTAGDIGIDTIFSPGATHPLNTPITVIARVRRYSGGAPPSFPVVCSIVSSNGYLRYTNTQMVLWLEPLDTVRVSFANYTLTFSEVESVILRTLFANDTNPANDRMSRACAIYSYYQDFEANNGGFIADPATGGWEWGVPTSGPSSAYSGVKCWGTGVYGPSADWNLNSCRYIALINNPLIGFMHWYQIESYYDGANIKYSTNDTNWTLLHPFIDPYNGVFLPPAFESCWTGTTAGNFWHPAVVVIPVNAGQIFWVRWHFHSDASVQYPGWYVDDVVGMGCVPFSGIEEVNTNNITITALNLARPNPIINGIAHISFTLAEPSQVSFRIYDASGRLIRTLVNEHKSSGIYNINWNCRDDFGRNVAKGIYFCTLETPKHKFVRKLVLIR
jgi:hypothetical protein